MKIAEVVDQAQTSGVTSTTGFTIHATAKSFRILSSGLYKDKFGTAPRELGANALDAHKDAGNPNPFHVHLPNVYDSFFSIRDFGTGMSRKKMETLYVSYFASDKSHTDDMIGGLGLGSKSPFCYVDQFTVISFHKGTKIMASAFLENGLPKLAILGEEETTEPNGMEISYPVKKDDIDEFNARAKKVYGYFKLKPIVTGVKDFKFDDVTYALQAANGKWALRNKIGDRYNTEPAIAIMGHIGYPIDANQLYYELDGKHTQVLKLPFEMEFNIGDLEIVASREGLEYDDKTKAALKQRIQEIVSDMKSLLQKKFDVCKTRFEAHALYGEILGYNTDSNSIQSMTRSVLDGCSFNWNGIEIKSERYSVLEGLQPGEVTVTHFWHGHSRGGKTRCKNSAVSTLTCNEALKDSLYKKDLVTGNLSRIRYHVRETQEDVYLLEFKDRTAHDIFFKTIGLSDSIVTYTSSLEKPPRVGGVRTHKSRNLKIVTDDSELEKTTIEIDSNKTYYYVRLDGNSLKDSYKNGVGLRRDDLVKAKRFLVKHGILKADDEIYGTCRHKMLDKAPNWVEFIDFALAKFKVVVKKHKLEQIYADHTEYVRLFDHYSMSVPIALYNHDKKHPKLISRKVAIWKSLKKKLSYLETQRNKLLKFININEMYTFLNAVQFSKAKTPKFKAEEIVNEFNERYPLAPYIRVDSNNDECIKQTLTYLSIV